MTEFLCLRAVPHKLEDIRFPLSMNSSSSIHDVLIFSYMRSQHSDAIGYDVESVL